MGCSFITLKCLNCNNQRPRCDIAWLRVTIHLYLGFPSKAFNQSHASCSIVYPFNSENRDINITLLLNKCGHRNVLSKRQVWMSIFHIINFKKKKKSWTQEVLDFFNKKLILDYYFCLKSGPVFLFQIFIIAPPPPPPPPLPLPRDIKLYH